MLRIAKTKRNETNPFGQLPYLSYTKERNASSLLLLLLQLLHHIQLSRRVGVDESSSRPCVWGSTHSTVSAGIADCSADRRRYYCCRNGCLLDDNDYGDDGGNARPRQIVPGPPGLMRTGTTAAESVTPTVDELDVVWRMLCADEADVFPQDVSGRSLVIFVGSELTRSKEYGECLRNPTASCHAKLRLVEEKIDTGKGLDKDPMVFAVKCGNSSGSTEPLAMEYRK